MVVRVGRIGVHNLFQPFLPFHVLYFIHHDAHGIAKQFIHFGFQLNALHVFHPRRVLFIRGLHFRVRLVGIRGLVFNQFHRFLDRFHASRDRDAFLIYVWHVITNFHKLVGFRQHSNEHAVVNNVV